MLIWKFFGEAWPIRDRQAAHDGEDPAGWTVSHRNRGGAPVVVPAVPPACSARVRPADRPGRRQSRGRHDRSGRAALSRPRQVAAGPADRACRHAARLWPPEPQDRDGRSRPSGAGCGGARGGAEGAADRRRGNRGRSRAGAVVGRRVRELDRAGGRVELCRQADGDAGAAALGRQHRRDEYAAKASVPHQGRASGPACTSRAGADARDLRRAG